MREPLRAERLYGHDPSKAGISHVTRREARHQDYTIAWICALHLELTASRAMLDEEHQSLPMAPGDDNTYVLGQIDQHNIVMTCLPGLYGTNNAAIVANNLHRSFPNILATLMVGIGGGCPSQADLYLGDVVVGTRVMQYDLGKALADGQFQPSADAKTPAPLLNSAVSNLRSRHGPHDASSRIASLVQSRLPGHARPSHPDRLFQSSYEHASGVRSCSECDPTRLQPRRQRLSDQPTVHYGVIASGNRVMRNGRERDEIARRHLALCFEMEAAGLMDNLRCLPIRGICDYSDSHKNKDWQDYAAATAAAYARELLEVLPASRELDRAATSFADARRVLRADDDKASERRRWLLESLDFPQIDARKTDIEPAHAKTCRWLLRHSAYLDWLEPELQSQNHGFLWMRGKAGAGKSTMMKFAYIETKKKYRNPSMAVASFFFNARGDYLEKSITGMYRSLLMQLFTSFSDLQLGLDDTDIVPWSQNDCPNLNALKELLRNAVMALGQRSLICFIDALDECDEQEVRDMVQFFEDLAEDTTEHGIQFRVFFSSRPYPYIDIRDGILFTLEDEPGHAEDLAQYVKSHLRITNRSLLADLQAQILDKAAGVFMWIVLVVGILNKESGNGALAMRTKLSEIPPRLSDLFRSILTRDNDRAEWLLLCVLWILCARRPLSPAEFRHALWAGLLAHEHEVDPELPDATDMDDCIRLITSSSKGLAEVTISREPTVQFIHESVRDYLVKEQGLQVLWPDIGFEWEGPSHEILKRCCTAYLRHPSVQAVAGDLEGDDRYAALKTCSFLEYASQQVFPHADAAALVVPQDDFLSQAFAPGGSGEYLFQRFRVQSYGLGVTPLYVLAGNGWGNLIRIRIKTESAAYVEGGHYEYPLLAALAKGHQDAVVALLDGGVDVHVKTRNGSTALMLALEGGDEAMARLLIANGVDIHAKNSYGETALMSASGNGHEAVARLLISRGTDIHARDSHGSTALMLASERGHEAVARLLIDKGVDIHTKNSHGATALISASRKGCKAVVGLLINKGADVNAATNRYRATALMYAAQKGHEAVARLLIDRGADVHAKDWCGETALILALDKGHHAVARLLIDNGADVNARNGRGVPVLTLASQIGYVGTAQLLIDKGANVNAKSRSGSTALMLASGHGNVSLAQLLIDKGADVNAKSDNGSTALMLASTTNHEAMTRLLRQV